MRREQDLAEREGRLAEREARVAAREQEVAARERAVDGATRPAGPTVSERRPAGVRARVVAMSRTRRVVALVIAVGALIALLAFVVLAARWLLATPPVQELVARYPGVEPTEAVTAFPAWLRWTHFFTVFLMALVIRTGLQIRRESRPAATWSSRRRPDRRVGLSVWTHQALDVLWLLNGLVYVVLLLGTGQWERIVPTSWTVFPHALSAGLQYLALDPPTDPTWTGYNGLQQLAYAVTVLIAAPLAVLSGARMSTWWPERTSRLNRVFRIEVARAIHYPVMLYFLVFVAVHVTLVMSTGALRNLGHMYAGEGASDWTGFWVFAASTVLIAAGLVAVVRPMLIAPIASLFGKVGR